MPKLTCAGCKSEITPNEWAEQKERQAKKRGWIISIVRRQQIADGTKGELLFRNGEIIERRLDEYIVDVWHNTCLKAAQQRITSADATETTTDGTEVIGK